MLKRLSNLSDDRLRYYVARIREIGSLGEEAAHIETDKLAHEIYEECDSTLMEQLQVEDEEIQGEGYEDEEELETARTEIAKLTEALKAFEQGFDVAVVQQADLEPLEEWAECLGEDWDATTTATLESQINEIRTAVSKVVARIRPIMVRHEVGLVLEQLDERIASVRQMVDKKQRMEDWYINSIRGFVRVAMDEVDETAQAMCRDEIAARETLAAELAEDAERMVCEVAIQDAECRPIYNVGTVRRILATTDDALNRLSEHGGVTEAHYVKIRAARERAARYRHDKRAAEAEVALAGNQRRAERLLREAKILLEQDWAEAFPGEELPTRD